MNNQLTNILKRQAMTNPLANNALQLWNAKDAKGLENLARNICKEKGIDADAMYRNISQRYTK